MYLMNIGLFDIKDKKKRKRAMFIYGYIAALVALFLIIYVIPSVTEKFSSTETVKYGTLQVGEETSGYIVRNDVVYVSPKTAKIKRIAESEDKLRKNTKIVKFVEEESESDSASSEYVDILKRLGKNIKEASTSGADRCGVLSYTIDGYETYFNPSNIDELDPDTAKDCADSIVEIEDGFSFAGDPVYKISDDKAWYYVFWTETDEMSKYETGKSVTICFDDSDESVEATVYDMDETRDGWRIALKTEDYYSRFTETRSADARIVVSDNSGLIVSKENITVKDGKAGVMVKDKTGKFNFVRVNVESTDGEHSVLTSTLFYDEEGKPVNTVQPYQEIKKKPGAQD